MPDPGPPPPTERPLSALLAALPAVKISGPTGQTITGLTADSRQVRPGSLFVAYRGVAVDGHRFVANAIERGAVAVAVEADAAVTVPPHIACLRVPDGREALAWLSAAWYGFPGKRMTVVGVTGTDGKTSTVNLIFAILRRAGLNVGMISTVNAVIGHDVLETGLHTTTPDAPDIQRYLWQMAQSGTDICLLEVTSHGLAQHRVTACFFDWAVVTNITHEHLDLHGSLEAYREAKARLFELAAAGAVLNADDDTFDLLRARVASSVRLITYGQSRPAMLRARDVTFLPHATRFSVHVDGRPPLTAETALVGAFNVSNILAALALTVEGLAVPPATALAAVREFSGVPGRMERIDAGQNFMAIVDFAHSPNALRRALEAVRPLTAGRVMAVFGCAGLRDVEKRVLMGRIAAQLADVTVITAEDPRTEDLTAIMAVTAGAMRECGAQELSPNITALPAELSGPAFIRRPDRGRAIFLAAQLARPGDVVIALGKGHEQSMCFGTTEYPWDDREAMRAALAGSPLCTLPTANVN